MLRVPVVCRILTVVLAPLAVASVASGDSLPGEPRPANPLFVPPAKAASLGRFPLTFEKNTGRYDKRVYFVTRTRGATAFITATELVMVLPAPGRRTVRGGAEPSGAGATPGSHVRAARRPRDVRPSAASVLRMKLVGANASTMASGLSRQPGIANYLIGNDPASWHTRVPTYAKAKLSSVYPGVDLVYYGTEADGQGLEAGGARNIAAPRVWGEGQGKGTCSLSTLEYDFIVRPGADPSRIRIAFEGADRVRVAHGDLIITTPTGDVCMKRPFAYQQLADRRVQIACSYALRGRRAALRIARYDATRPLVIDPVLEYATYLGGDSSDSAGGVAVDATGAAYVAGRTTANRDFPTTAGAYGATSTTSSLYVTKIDPSGSYLVYSTYIGGGADDTAVAITVDAGGAAYVVGKSKGSLPTTAGAYQTTLKGGFDGYAMKLDPTGSSLVYSTRLGGSSDDAVLAIALDPSGAVFLAGETASSSFPTTPGAFQTVFEGTARKAFVAKLDASGSNLIFSTFLGKSTGVSSAYGIAADPDGCTYVAGYTQASTFPTTPGAFQTTYAAPGSAFVTKLDPAASALVYSTFLGGPGAAYGYLGTSAGAIALDAAGCAYVVGFTGSKTFPITAGAFQTQYGGGNEDAFVTKLDPTGSALVYSSYLGGGGMTGMGGAVDRASTVRVDGLGVAYVAGFTVAEDFPVTPYAFQTVNYGNEDGFICWISPSGGELLYSTYFGGWDYDSVSEIALQPDGSITIAGTTASADFPATPGAFQGTRRGSSDAFVAKLGSVVRTPTTLTVPMAGGTVGQSTDLSALYAVAGSGEPLVGHTVRFWVAGRFVGDAATDAAGWATLPFVVPTGLAPWAVVAATCAGDGVFHSAGGSGVLVISRAGTSLVVDDASGAAGSVVQLSAALTRTSDSAPLQKKIAFTDSGTRIGAVNTSSSGRATLSYPIPAFGPLGLHTIGAQFAGDVDYDPSSGVATLNVTIGTTLYTIDRSGTISEPVTLRGYLRRADDLTWLDGLALGFRVDGTHVGSAITGAGGTSGRADLNWIVSEGPATRPIVAEFVGDAAYAPSAATSALTCRSYATKMVAFARTARITDRTELKARLVRSDDAPLYAKSINFYVDGTFVITRPTNVEGYASYPYYDIPDGAGSGVRTILAEWPGNGGYSATSRTADLTVLRAIPYIWVLSKSVAQGVSANLYAYFRRLYDYRKQEGKPVTFKVDGTWIADVMTGIGSDAGVARYLHATGGLSVGAHTIRCEFAGDAWVDAGYGEATLTIL